MPHRHFYQKASKGQYKVLVAEVMAYFNLDTTFISDHNLATKDSFNIEHVRF